jgi:hypothetical protein
MLNPVSNVQAVREYKRERRQALASARKPAADCQATTATVRASGDHPEHGISSGKEQPLSARNGATLLPALKLRTSDAADPLHLCGQDAEAAGTANDKVQCKHGGGCCKYSGGSI